MIVNEIFYSIQGESTRAGAPCVFVRLTGCNLRCVYCDTAYAFAGGTEMSLDEIESTVEKHRCSFVTITGGEPLLQPDVHPLMSRLVDRGYDVQVETGGSLDISGVDPRVRVILDVKTPGSGMMERFDWENLARLRPGDEVKFVVMGREDYDWTVRVLKTRPLPAGVPVLVSPAHGTLDPRQLAGWMTGDALSARLHLQIHKYIWGPHTRRV